MRKVTFWGSTRLHHNHDEPAFGACPVSLIASPPRPLPAPYPTTAISSASLMATMCAISFASLTTARST